MTSWCDVMRWLRPLMLMGCKGDRLERPAGWLFGGRQLHSGPRRAGLGATQSSAAPAVQEHPRATRLVHSGGAGAAAGIAQKLGRLFMW